MTNEKEKPLEFEDRSKEAPLEVDGKLFYVMHSEFICDCGIGIDTADPRVTKALSSGGKVSAPCVRCKRPLVVVPKLDDENDKDPSLIIKPNSGSNRQQRRAIERAAKKAGIIIQ